jgi:TRAP-type C4-dicarboxylate transport system permease small subunit
MKAGLNRLIWALTLCAAFLVFVLMMLTVADVVGRIFRAPVEGAYDITKYSLGVLLFTALPAVTAADRHLTVDLFLYLISERQKRALRAVSSFFAAFVLGIFAWQLWEQGLSKAEAGQTLSTLNIPVAPFAYGLAILSGVSCLVATMKFVTELGIADLVDQDALQMEVSPDSKAGPKPDENQGQER